MYEILEKKVLSETVKLMEVKAPLIAKKAKAGQFIILLLLFLWKLEKQPNNLVQ